MRIADFASKNKQTKKNKTKNKNNALRIDFFYELHQTNAFFQLLAAKM